MPDNLSHPTKVYRKNAGYSQEQAAELLNVSTRTLSRYESGEAIISIDILVKMSEIYNAPELLIVDNPAAITCMFARASKELPYVVDSLTEIFSDNYVDESEIGIFNKTLKEILKVKEACDLLLAYGSTL